MIQKIVLERLRQDLKWGPVASIPKDRTPEHWLAILMEEIGEVSEAVVELAAGEADWEHSLETELIQSAAVIVSWLEWREING